MSKCCMTSNILYIIFKSIKHIFPKNTVSLCDIIIIYSEPSWTYDSIFLIKISRPSVQQIQALFILYDYKIKSFHNIYLFYITV